VARHDIHGQSTPSGFSNAKNAVHLAIGKGLAMSLSARANEER
jgi:hypothetical protein